ncbi:MAG TPA: hypothetical protein VLR49_12130 [Ferruginibacter sp.]|nr:hypothetical protein [Ferruginibacter sp.]
MKQTITLLLLLFILSCNNQEKSDPPKTVTPAPDTALNIIPVPVKVDKDTLILNATKQILTALKNKDYKQFSTFIHPVLGVRFSPYGYIDTGSNLKFNTGNFLDKNKTQGKLNWGNYDGSGDEMVLSINEYFAKFVYNADFVNAEKTSLNKMIGSGNSLNNLEKIYKDCDFTESYFSGFDKKYNGMDWTCLRLVFKNYNDNYYLVGVVHDQWTI